jgi:hypothetical protein
LNGKLFFFFLLFRQNLVALAGHRRQIFWVCQFEFSTFLYLITEPPHTGRTPPPHKLINAAAAATVAAAAAAAARR